ncbi:MAG: hypothetical protein AVDCRST_MAG30-4546, partial [uncultured Solirubrobacteraceae bacterium]
ARRLETTGEDPRDGDGAAGAGRRARHRTRRGPREGEGPGGRGPRHPAREGPAPRQGGARGRRSRDARHPHRARRPGRSCP